MSGEIPLSDVFLELTVLVLLLGLSENYSCFNFSALCFRMTNIQHWALNVLYIKFQIREWKHFLKSKNCWIMWAIWKLFSGAI